MLALLLLAVRRPQDQLARQRLEFWLQSGRQLLLFSLVSVFGAYGLLTGEMSDNLHATLFRAAIERNKRAIIGCRQETAGIR